MGRWEWPALAAAALVAGVLVLVLARRRGWIGRTFAAITALLAAAWIVANELVARDYRDADGYVDCWPSCTVLQDTVGLAIWYGPVLWVVLAVLAAVLAALSRRRRT